MAHRTRSEVRKVRYTTETIARKIEGPYTGKRFSHMSDDMLNVCLTIEYRFDGFVIRVVDVPARWDRRHDREYLSGKVGLALNRRVTEIAAKIEHERHGREGTPPQVREMLRHLPLSVSLHAPEFLHDAA
jgi:hypothetical protein